MKTSLLSFVVMATVAVPSLSARTVIGQILDETKEPLPGATVLVQGTSKAVSTDISGNFRLEADPGQTLTISYIGYEAQNAKVPAAGDMRIIMKEASSQLDEVVVVGVSMKKSDLTGAVTSVDAETLTEKPVTTINEALAGRVAGVSVGKASSPQADASIKIRGTNTINSGSDPIYVIDGLVMDNSYGFFNSINVNDVESIQVLKDASATALYGSRGANGVIVITTKKGKAGRGEVTYDGWVSWSNPTSRPETMNAQQLAELRIDAYANGYLFNNPETNREEYIQNTILGSNIAFEDREFATMEAGKSYDWMDQVTRTGFEQNHNIAFSRASDKSNVYISLGINTLDGIMVGTERDRYTGRVNASADITPWLRVGTNTSYTYSKDKITDGSVYNQALYNGNPLLDYGPFKDDATRYNPENLNLFWRVQSGETINNFNPFNSLDITTDRSRYHLTSSNYININPIKGLNIRSTFAIDRAEQFWAQYVPTGIQESLRYYHEDAYAKQQRHGQTQWQWDNTISYENTFNQVHRFSAFAGTSTSRYSDGYLAAYGERFASNDLGYHGLFSASTPDFRQIQNGWSENSLMSYVARVNYSYDYRYFATVTTRWDGSSRFADGHKWGFFPSFSLAWDITNEHFFPKTDWVDQIKLRGGFGIVGNQAIGNFMYTTLYTPYASNEQAIYGTDGRRGTPDISWEKQKQTNIGLDLGFFNRRLNVTLDAFFINNSNLLMSHTLPTTSGYTYTVENIGEMSNKGFELTINATPVQTRDFVWNISANLALDRNKITRLYGGVERLLSGGRTGNYFVDQPLNNVYLWEAAGIANEADKEVWSQVQYLGRNIYAGDLYVVDRNKDGKIDADDKHILSNMDPKFYGGFSTDLTWKNLTLNAVFNYSVGGHAISGYYENLVSSVGLSNASTDLLDRWSPTNTTAEFPRVMTNATGHVPYYAWETDRYIQNTSFLRLSTLSLSYNLPKNILQKIRFNNLRVYFTASNVFCLTGYKGFDPEYGDGAGYFPAERTYTLGVSFSVF